MSDEGKHPVTLKAAVVATEADRADIDYEAPKADANLDPYRDDLAAAQALLAASGIAPDRISYLRGDVCRRELDVELEGVFAAG